jgi:hypothetical protein
MNISTAQKRKAHYSFPVKEVGGKIWCAVSQMGVKRVEIVAYSFDRKEKYTFAGGHRHRWYIAHDDIHICFPEGIGQVLDIEHVPSHGPPKRRQ